MWLDELIWVLVGVRLGVRLGVLPNEWNSPITWELDALDGESI
jgi:hypothetical protein